MWAIGSASVEPIAHIDLVDVTQEDRAAMMRGEGLLTGKPVSEIRWAILQDQWGQPRADLTEHAFSTSRVPVGQIGEIVVTGDHVLKGYLQGVGNPETKFRVGNEIWHRTGDAGSVDSAGRLWLHGRCAAVINDERGRLYPFGVECAAMMFAQVLRAAVLSEGGKRLLVIEGKLDTHETRRLAEATAWAHIDRICPIRQLPVDKRHNAKIDYDSGQQADMLDTEPALIDDKRSDCLCGELGDWWNPADVVEQTHHEKNGAGKN